MPAHEERAVDQVFHGSGGSCARGPSGDTAVFGFGHFVEPEIRFEPENGGEVAQA
ncbi:MAG: hypothetical protein AAGG56_17455 [Pseudomonadota bacterium]